jgi:ketosteroid isomerase-like protein
MSRNEIIRRFFDAVNERDTPSMGAALKPEAEFHFPKTEPLVGRERILRFFNILFRQYPELTFDVRRVILQEEQAAVHWTNHGMSRRRKPYQNEGVTILELDGNEIRFMSDFFKDTEKF